MKNIHILKTDQPSKLHYYFELNKKYALSKEPLNWRTASHIYITSSGEIKEGDWWFNTIDKIIFKVTKEDVLVTSQDGIPHGFYKIILTTDPTLIADGVQAIEDEFLKWFVKNPTCEFVETELLGVSEVLWEEYFNKYGVYPKYPYYEKIIIPQEEPKEDLEKEMFELEQELDIPSSMRWHNSKPKQETLEEAAERLQKDKYGIFISKDADVKGQLVINTARAAFKSGMIEGAKWQAERMYSEVIEFAEWIRIKDFQTASKNNWIGLDMKYYTTQELFEQFKKK
jgi:hypothetical protein